MNRVAIVFCGSLITTACATTQPYEAAGIDYRLPRTDAAVTAALTLESCSPLRTQADLEIAAKAAAQDGVYHVAGQDLASARIKRDVKISLSDGGVISGINSANADKTPEIIGNVIKIAGAVGTAVMARPIAGQTGPPPFSLECKRDVANGVSRAAWLTDEISRVRAQLVKQPTNQALVKALNRSTRELAILQEGILMVKTTATVSPDPPTPPSINPTPPTSIPATAVEFDTEPFSKWFKEPVGSVEQKAYQLALVNAFGMDWTAKTLPPPTAVQQPVRPPAKQLRACGFAIAVPAVAALQFDVIKTGTALPDGLQAKKIMPAAQWAAPNKLCLDVGFGEQRTVNLTFDKFGQTTQFEWGSEATAATVSGALAGYAADTASLVGTIRGHSLASKKAEIDEIETDQKLEELRICKRIRDAGGDCKSGE